MITGRKRQLPMDDNAIFIERNGVMTSVIPLTKTGTAVSQVAAAELGGDKQMALQGNVIKDAYIDPATGISYDYRMYAILGNYGNTCCQWRSLALYLSNNGRDWIRPVLNQVEFPCGSGNKSNNIVHLGPGGPFKFGDKYYLYYESYAPCNEPGRFLESSNGVTGWVDSSVTLESLFLNSHYQDGTIKVIKSPVDGVNRLYTRAWLKQSVPNEEISPAYNPTTYLPDLGRAAVWVPIANFPALSSWPPSGWSNYEVNNGHGKPDFHPATINGVANANAIALPAESSSGKYTGWDPYTHAVTEMNTEVDDGMAPLFISLNTHYHYTDCHHRGYLSYSRDGMTFSQRYDATILDCGAAGSADAAYFYINPGAIRSADKIIHLYTAAKYGGKPGCGTYVAGDQSIQMGEMRLDGYIENVFSTGNTALTRDWQIPSDGYASILKVNARSRGTGAWCKAQIETSSGSIIPGFSFADCVGISGDHVLDGAIQWNTSSLSSISGQIVRIRIQGNNVGVCSLWMEQGDKLPSSSNYQFPVVAYTHSMAYMDGNVRFELGCNAVDIATNHVDYSYVIDWIVANKIPVYLRNDAVYGYESAKSLYTKWKNSAARDYICGIALFDEPREANQPALKLLEDKTAFNGVFPGLPVILNLNIFGTEAYNYAKVVQPDMLSYEIYPVISKEGNCSYAAQWTGSDNIIDAICNSAKDVFNKGGMKESNNQRIMIIFGTYGFGSCIEKRASVGQVWGYGLFDQMFTVTKNNLGSLFGGAKNYAWCTDNDAQIGPSGQRDHTPYEHPYVRPYAKYFNNLIYNANLSTPWSVGIAVPPPSSIAVSIDSFSATSASIKPGESSKLAWTASNYTSLSISGIGTVTGNSITVSPSVTTTYTLTAIGVSGQVTKDVTVTVSSSGANSTLSLENLSYIYANTTTKFRLANPGSKTITKIRIWFFVGDGLPLTTNRGIVTLDADSQGFTYKADDFICDGAIFYMELSDGTAPEYWFRQISKPTVNPGSIVGKAGDVVSITLNQSNNETISGATSSNTAVATVTYSGTIATVTFVAAGSANIVLTPSTASLFRDTDLSISVPVTASNLPVLTSGDANLVLTASGSCSVSSTYSDIGVVLLNLKATGSCVMQVSAPEILIGECNLVLKASGFCLPSNATPIPDSGVVQLFLKAIGSCTITSSTAPIPITKPFAQTVEVFFE